MVSVGELDRQWPPSGRGVALSWRCQRQSRRPNGGQGSAGSARAKQRWASPRASGYIRSVKDWNNTIIRLAPAEIVAKVATSHFRDARLESLDREVAVAAHLAGRGAPVVSRRLPRTSLLDHTLAGLTAHAVQYIELAPGSTPRAAEIVKSDFVV
jgi:hypothetical protein